MMRTSTLRKNLVAGVVALCAACLVGAFAMTAPAFAESMEASWDVTFTDKGTMESNYSQDAVNEALAGMQPGDDMTLAVKIANNNARSTDWYMKSSVLETLEQTSDAAGGAYTYRLVFNDGTAEKVLYDSQRVGGVDSDEKPFDGFREITNATGSWFYLSTLGPNKTGNVYLEMALDGHTLGNDYMRTLGSLQISFAVEYSDGGEKYIVEQTLPPKPTQNVGGEMPQTGDSTMTIVQILGFAALIACVVTGATLLRRGRKGSDA